jgi:hypothetical protein
MTLGYGLMEVRAHLAWCEDTLSKLPPLSAEDDA